MRIKEWKEREILGNCGASFMESVDGVERETEKAVLLSVTVGYSSDLTKMITVWCPKSALLTEEEYDEEVAKEVARIDAGLDYNKKLNAFAKENGIKGIREMMRTVTLIKKIEEAGLAVPARA